jgi:hypothetical protein
MKIPVIITFFILLCFAGYSQCTGFPATIAESSCGSGVALTSNANINSGTYSFCGTSSTPTSFTGLNLAGGTITICGNANLSGNWNSGNIVVACGATVTFPSGLLMNNNIRIINYGRVNVTGNLVFQNNGNCFYNESANSLLYVSGNLTFPLNNGQTAYLKNNGYISVGNAFNAYDGGYTCFGSGGQMETQQLNYGVNCGAPANRFTFGSGTGTAVIRFTGSAVLRSTLTASSSYRINAGSPATVNLVCGSWGSAVVAVNSPAVSVPSAGGCVTNPNGCFTALPVELTAFAATLKDGAAVLDWVTESEHNNDYFAVERSSDGTEWEKLSEVKGAGDSEEPLRYNYTDVSPLPGISYYRLVQVDLDGRKTSSEVRSIEVGAGSSCRIWPNPSSGELNVLLPDGAGSARVVLTDSFGRAVKDPVNILQGKQRIDLGDLRPGTYLATIVPDNGPSEIVRLVLRP